MLFRRSAMPFQAGTVLGGQLPIVASGQCDTIGEIPAFRVSTSRGRGSVCVTSRVIPGRFPLPGIEQNASAVRGRP